MPIVTITLQSGRPAATVHRIMDAIHQATVEALGIADSSRNQRLVEIDPAYYFYPEGRSEHFMTIEIASFPGRSEAAKAALFQLICDKLQQAVGIDARDLMILIHEPPLTNWGINGKPATRFKSS